MSTRSARPPARSSRSSGATHCGRSGTCSPPSRNIGTHCPSPRNIDRRTGARPCCARSPRLSGAARTIRRPSAISSKPRRASRTTRTPRKAGRSVGSACHALKRYEESLQHYDRALQLARLVGNLRLVAYATMNRCASLMDLGRYPESAADLEEAKRLFQVLEEPDTLFLLDIYEGQRAFGLGRWSRAVRLWEHGLTGLREVGDRSDLARALLCVGRFHAQRGEEAAARAYLEESRDLAKAMG